MSRRAAAAARETARKERERMRLLLVLAMGIALAAAPAIADTWTEQGDAGELPGIHQVPVGNDPFTMIYGVFTGDATNADMFCINIVDHGGFMASTVGLTTNDTQLFLFDMDGFGITFNDDDPAGGLQSTITGQFVPANGEYLLAVSSGWTFDPLDPAGAEMWLDSPYSTERAPDGPGAAGPISGWTGTANTGEYGIALTGVGFCESTPVESATWGTIKSMYR
jgi:hypothetical protein